MTIIADQISKNSELIDIDQIVSLTDFIVDMKNNNNRVFVYGAGSK